MKIRTQSIDDHLCSDNYVKHTIDINILLKWRFEYSSMIFSIVHQSPDSETLASVRSMQMITRKLNRYKQMEIEKLFAQLIAHAKE